MPNPVNIQRCECTIWVSGFLGSEHVTAQGPVFQHLDQRPNSRSYSNTVPAPAPSSEAARSKSGMVRLDAADLERHTPRASAVQCMPLWKVKVGGAHLRDYADANAGNKQILRGFIVCCVRPCVGRV